MPASAKKKPDPLSPFKRAVSLATRTLAENKSVNVTFGSDTPGFDGKTIRLPQPSRAVTRKEIAVIRGFADAMALLIAEHDQKLHARFCPSSGEAKAIFDAVERARVEAVGSLRMRGVAKNLTAKLASQYERLPEVDIDRQECAARRCARAYGAREADGPEAAARREWHRGCLARVGGEECGADP